MRHATDERGAVGGVEGLAFGVLIFVFGTLVVLNGWGVVDAKLATSAAAREAGRTFVESNSEVEATEAADAAATSAMEGHNRQASSVSVEVLGAGSYGRCRPVRITVAAEVPRVPLPLLGRAGGKYTVTSAHTGVVDPYRSGLTGAAQCAQ